jgi:hypothetical protein
MPEHQTPQEHAAHPPHIVYLPKLTGARVVRTFRFRAASGPYCCVLVTDCRCEESPEYAHVLYVHRGLGVFGPACFAVAAEVNRLAAPGSGRSHFLGVFHGASGPMHENLGSSDEWADMERFAHRALEIVASRFSPASPPVEFVLAEEVIRFYEPPRTRVVDSETESSIRGSETPRHWGRSTLGRRLLAIGWVLWLIFAGMVTVATALAIFLSGYLAITYPNRDTLLFLGGSVACGLLVCGVWGVRRWLASRARQSRG